MQGGGAKVRASRGPAKKVRLYVERARRVGSSGGRLAGV